MFTIANRPAFRLTFLLLAQAVAPSLAALALSSWSTVYLGAGLLLAALSYHTFSVLKVHVGPPQYFKAVIAGYSPLLVLFLLGDLSKIEDYYHRDVVWLWSLALPFWLLASIRGSSYWEARLPLPSVLLLGPGPEMARLAAEFQKEGARLSWLPAGIVDTSDTASGFDQVYLSPALTPEEQEHLATILRDSTASVHVVPGLDHVAAGRPRIAMVGSIPVITLHGTPFLGLAAVAKRAEDLVLGLPLLVLALPLLLLVALLVKLSSKGPVLFRQLRYGFGGEPIVVYKFRTMRVMEDGPVVAQATRNDPRVTPIGRFLRRTSLDELPQLLNVAQGSMSLVGPRPHAVAHNEYYRKLIDGYMTRHSAKPGITGLAQVRGQRGETETLSKMEARVASDLEYLREWSILLDLYILARTPFSLRGKSAY